MSHVRVDTSTGCWEWTGGKNHGGYGVAWIDGKARIAHRAIYELDRGPIPDRAQLDHLCRNRACVNPTHLEPVTPAVNIQRSDHAEKRKTHCPKGHPYDEANTRVVASSGHRKCRECTRAAKRAYYQRTKGDRLAPPGARTHCPRGHEYTPENTYIQPSTGSRICRTCASDRVR